MFAGYRHCKKCGKELMGLFDGALFDGALCDECEEEENRRMKDYEQIATNIMMTALEGVKAQIRKVYDKGYKDGIADTPFTDTEEAENKAYNRGLNEAWNAAIKIHDGQIPYEAFGLDKTGNGFTYASPLNWGETITAKEAIAKIKEYEDKQKQDAKIKVGDEVYSDAFDDKGIVTHITADKVACVCIICNGSTMMKVGVNGLHKTGRHFPEIAEVLKEMRGAENDE